MPEFLQKDITRFQSLYSKHYRKQLNISEAQKKIQALKELLTLVWEIELQKASYNPHASISEPE